MHISKKAFQRAILSIFLFIILINFYNSSRQLIIINYVFYGFVFLAVIFCIFNGMKEEYLINPFLLFSIVPISLLMYDISVSTHYLVELKEDTYFLAIYNIFMVIFGLLFGKKFPFKFSKVWKKSINLSNEYIGRQALILMTIGMFPTLYGCLTGIRYFLSMNFNMLKAQVNSTPLASIFSLFLYLGLFCCLGSHKKRIQIVCMIAMLFSLFCNFSKTTVVMLCMCVITYMYDKSIKNKKIKKYFIFLVIIAIFFTFISFSIYNNMRFDYNINNYFNKLGYVGNISSTFFLPIMYIISPWSNLQYIVETTTSYSYGLWVIKPFLSYLQIDEIWKNVFELIPRYQAFNTYTYISIYYRDFGYVGSGICSFFLALYIMYIYRLKRRFNGSNYISAVFTLNMYATVMMFFNNHFHQLSYPFTILIITWTWLKLIKPIYKNVKNKEIKK